MKAQIAFQDLPVVWLGRYLTFCYRHAVPQNDNMWRFGYGPDSVRKILAEEKRKR